MNAELQRVLADHATHVGALSIDVKANASHIEALNAAVTKLLEESAAAKLNGGGGTVVGNAGPAFAALGDYAKAGGDIPWGRYIVARPQAGMTVQSDPDGGFTSQPEIDSGIETIVRTQSPLLGLVNTRPTTRGEYKKTVDDSEVASGWVGETEVRPQTVASKLRQKSFSVNEVYAMPAVSQTLLDDNNADVGNHLVGQVGIEFGTKLGAAIVSGTGINQPLGFLQIPTDTNVDFVRDYEKFQHVAAGSTSPSSDQLVAALIELSMTLRVPYRPGATWLMNRTTARVIRQLRDENGLLLWSGGGDGRLAEGVPTSLLGFPVALCEDMPDIGANAYPIAFADWKRAYLVVDRAGIRVLRDPFTAKPHVLFYCTKRVGGGPDDYNALKLLKCA